MDAQVQQTDRIGVLEELLNERYSVRAFLAREVDRATIEHVLTTAQRTASWCNSQPWQVIIASGDKAAYAKQALENYNFFGAPHVAIIHTDEPLGIYGAIDCGAYVSNFMLSAQALGLGTIPQAAIARHSGLIRRHFKLPDDRRIVCGISFGYADDAHKVNSYRTSRASVAETVTFVDD